MTTLVPIPMKLKAITKKMMTWFATPSAATAPSETWLTMKVSTVPISMRSVCSAKIGQAIPIRESLTARVGDIGKGRTQHTRTVRLVVKRSPGDAVRRPTRKLVLGPARRHTRLHDPSRRIPFFWAAP